jgi:hypothetical protein
MLAGVVMATPNLLSWDNSASAENVGFNNDLTDCVAIKVREISGNVVAARPFVTLARPTGECGCLCALTTYTGTVDRRCVRQVLQTGLVSLMSGGEKVFVLATDPALIVKKKVAVALGCTGPWSGSPRSSPQTWSGRCAAQDAARPERRRWITQGECPPTRCDLRDILSAMISDAMKIKRRP